MGSWATEWMDRWVEDDVEVRDDVEVVVGSENMEERRLVVVKAGSAAEARLESGLIDHSFRPATDEQLATWRSLSGRSLNDDDVKTLLRFLAKAQRTMARSRAKDYAAAAGLTTRGMNQYVLTPEGLAELRSRGIAARGNDPAPLLDALVRDGIPQSERSLATPDHFRARTFAEMRGKLVGMLETSEAEGWVA